MCSVTMTWPASALAKIFSSSGNANGAMCKTEAYIAATCCFKLSLKVTVTAAVFVSEVEFLLCSASVLLQPPPPQTSCLC